MSEAKIILTAVDNTRAAFESAKQGLQGLHVSATAVKATLVGLGAAAAAVSFANTVHDAIEAADQLNKLSQRTGVAVEQLSELQFAAKLSDVSTDSLATAMKKLNVSIAEGLAGDKEKVQAFKNLGVSLRDANGNAITADKALVQLADTFSTAKDGASKTAYAVALMGKAGDEMVPFLNNGGRAIEDLMLKARRMGLTISTDFARQAEEFNDNLTILDASSKKLAISMASDVVAGLGKASKAMADAAVEGGKFAGIIAGIQTLLTGDDQHKTNVKIVELTDHLLAAQNRLDRARAEGDEANSKRMAGVIAGLQKELAMYQRIGKEISAQSQKEEQEKPKQVKDLKPIPKDNGSQAQLDAFIKQIDEKIAAEQKELEVGRQLSESERFEAKILADLVTANSKLSAAQQQQVKDRLAKYKATDLELQQGKQELEQSKQIALQVFHEQAEWAAFDKARADERDRVLRSYYDEKQALQDTTEQLSLDTFGIFQNDAARQRALETLRIEQELKNRIEEINRNLLLDEKARALAIADATANADLKKQLAAMQEMQSNLRAVDDIGKEVFQSLFEKGDDTWKRLAQSLKTSLIDMLYQLTVRPFILNIAANFMGMPSMPGVVGNASGGVNALSSGLNMASALKSGWSIGSQWLGGGMSTANAAGTLYANATGTGIDGLLATNGAYGTSAGAGGAAGGGMAGAGMIGAAITAGMITSGNLYKAGYRWENQGAYTMHDAGLTINTGILKALGVNDKTAAILTGSSIAAAVLQKLGLVGEKRGGGQYGYSFNGADVLNARRGSMVGASGIGAMFLEGPNGGDPAAEGAKASINSAVATIQTLLDSIGSQIKLTQYQGGYESSDKGRGGVFAGGTFSNGLTFGETGKGDNYAGTLYESSSARSGDLKEIFQNFVTDNKQAVIEAVQALAGEIPKTLSDIVAGVDAEGLSDEAAQTMVDKILGVVQTVEQLGAAVGALPKEFDALKNASFDAKSALVADAGSIDNLTAKLGNFYDKAFTPQEKVAAQMQQLTGIFEKAGVVLPTTIEGYRAAVLSAEKDINSEAGLHTFETLLDNFDLFYQATQQASAGLADASSAMTQWQQAYFQSWSAIDKAAGSAQSSMQSFMGSVLSDMQDKWKALLQSISDEVAKIRGEWKQAATPANLVQNEAQFFSLAAIAQSGGSGAQKAAEQLPALAEALLSQSRVQATSATAQRALEARIAQAMADAYGPLKGLEHSQMLGLASALGAEVHTGNPSAWANRWTLDASGMPVSRFGFGSKSDSATSELRAIRDEVRALHSTTQQAVIKQHETMSHIRELRNFGIFVKNDPNGTPLVTTT